MQVRTVGEALPSPDGKWLAYTVTEAVMEEEVSENRTHIHVARTDGSRRFQLTRGESGASSPQFSADSHYVFFRSRRGEGTNVWRIALDGGEAELVNQWKGSMGAFAVSPDGKKLAFIGKPKDDEIEKRRKQKLDFRVVDEDEANSSLWVAELKDGVAQGEPRELTSSKDHVTEFAWAPDSSRLAYVRQDSELADHWHQATLHEIALAGGEAARLAADRRGISNVYYSPDGARLAFQWTPQPAKWAGECTFALLDRAGGQLRDLPDSMPDECGRGTGIMGWTGDSTKLIFRATNRVSSVIRSMSLDGKQATLYEPQDGVISGYGSAAKLDAAGKSFGFALEAPDAAPEAYWMELTGSTPRKLSAVNDELDMPPLGQTETLTWKSPDGTEVEGLLVYPVGYEQGKRYPMVLNIHGGPMGVFQRVFIGKKGLYPVAAFASEGYAVLQPNPRGSSGYGKEFRLANYNDWGGGDYEDIMAGVDHVIEMGVADPERMVVMGWSYGGYMTSWIIGHTDRFLAAAAGAAVTNLWSFTGTADIPTFIPDYFDGEPWQSFDKYAKHSPMRHVDRVTTPTLILHGEADLRVPISQSYELFTALKRRGVETEMVVYPRQPHGPTEPKFVLDVMQRHLELAKKYLGEAP